MQVFVAVNRKASSTSVNRTVLPMSYGLNGLVYIGKHGKPKRVCNLFPWTSTLCAWMRIPQMDPRVVNWRHSPLWIVAFHGQASICITSAFVEAMDTGGTKITPPPVIKELVQQQQQQQQQQEHFYNNIYIYIYTRELKLRMRWFSQKNHQ